MRTIKFRGFNRKNNEWLHGFYLQNRGAHFVCPDEFATNKSWDDYEVDPETVGQFTGLLDKNGKEIYEGDIIEQAAFRYDKNVHRYRMAWIDNTGEFGAFEIGKPIGPPTMYSLIAHFCKIMEVIGNIHDTPELLETTK